MPASACNDSNRDDPEIEQVVKEIKDSEFRDLALLGTKARARLHERLDRGKTIALDLYNQGYDLPVPKREDHLQSVPGLTTYDPEEAVRAFNALNPGDTVTVPDVPVPHDDAGDVAGGLAGLLPMYQNSLQSLIDLPSNIDQ